MKSESLPVWLRVGDTPEFQIGTLEVDGLQVVPEEPLRRSLASALRAAADRIESGQGE